MGFPIAFRGVRFPNRENDLHPERASMRPNDRVQIWFHFFGFPFFGRSVAAAAAAGAAFTVARRGKSEAKHGQRVQRVLKQNDH